MSRADELANELIPIPKLEDGWDDILEYRNAVDSAFMQRYCYIKGYEQASKDYIEYAQLWVDSGEVNIKSFKQFLKDRGYE